MIRLPGVDLAALAGAEFRRRREVARRKAGSGTLDLATAEALLRPWAALALRAGAEPAALAPDGALADVAWNLEQLRTARTIDSDRPGCTDHDARRIVADDVAPFAEVRATLAAARDDAVARALGSTDPAHLARSHDLSVLAIAFGCPPFAPVPERIAA